MSALKYHRFALLGWIGSLTLAWVGLDWIDWIELNGLGYSDSIIHTCIFSVLLFMKPELAWSFTASFFSKKFEI